MALDSEFFVKLGLKATNFKKGLKDAGGDVDELGRKLGGLEKETSAATKGLEGTGEAAQKASTGTKSFTTSLKGIKTALIASGIGLLVVALGEIVDNWREIIFYFDTAARRQKALNELSQKQEEFSNERLKTLRLQNDLIRLQGGSLDDNIDKQKKELTFQLGIALAAKDRLATEVSIAKANVDRQKNVTTFTKGGRATISQVDASPEELAQRKTAVLELETSLEKAQQRADLLQKSIVQLLKDPDVKKTTDISAALGLPKASEIDNRLQDSIDKQVAAGKRAYKGLSDYILDLEETTGQGQVQIRADVDEKLLEQKDAFLTALKELNEDVNQLVNEGFADAIGGFAEAIGSALVSGDNVLQAVGTSLLGTLGGILVQLGKMVVAVGVGILAVDAGLKSLNPYVALAAGAGLIALGSAFKGAASSLAPSGGSDVGGASVNSGGGTTTTFSGSGSGGDFNGRVVFEIAGDKLIGVLNNTSLGGLRVGDNELITTG